MQYLSLASIKIRFHKIRTRYLLGAVILLGLLYVLLLSLDRTVHFSYTGLNCIPYVTLFPNAYKVGGDSAFRVYSTDDFVIGRLRLASSNLCFEPTKAPQTGISKVELSPFGWLFVRKTFSLQVPESPQVNTSIFEKPVSATQKLKLDLTKQDNIFVYRLVVDDKQINCDLAEQSIVCNMAALGLAQGTVYNLKLQKSFNETIETLFEKEIKTLEAARVTSSSIKMAEVVYARPKSIEVVFDKKLTTVKARLSRVEGDSKNEVTNSTSLLENKVVIAYEVDLARQASYELEIFDVVAEDGSGLEAPYVIPFSTSGGPKATHISVGQSGVALGATATLTFDQAIAEDQDIGKAVVLSGGATVAGKKGNQIFISLRNVPMCSDFSIKINDELRSSYGISGGSTWTFTGRMICHSIAAIGYSQKGRAINAYSFGQGNRAIVFTGAIHGNELSTKLLMERWIADLEAKARSIPADKKIIVIPQLNPDGIAAGTRTNARNVDLNRNFAASNWQRDVTDVYNRPFPGGGGASPASEAETRAIAGYVSRLRPIVVLSYHSIGGVVVANLASNSKALTNTYAQASGYKNATGSTDDTFEYAVTGTAEDWYAEVGIGSILVELSSHTYHQFERNQKAMWAMVNS